MYIPRGGLSGRLFGMSPGAASETSQNEGASVAHSNAGDGVTGGGVLDYSERVHGCTQHISGHTFSVGIKASWSSLPTSPVGGAMQCLALLRCLGDSLRLLSQYLCAEALGLLEGCTDDGVLCTARSVDYHGIPQAQFSTGWVLRQCAVCYYEMSEYAQAKTYFEAMRRMEPYRVDGLEIYSTVLWHLKAGVLLYAFQP